MCIDEISTPSRCISSLKSCEPTFPRSPVRIRSISEILVFVSERKLIIVSAAAGAIAAPMLFASLISRSFILPIVTCAILAEERIFDISAAPAPVTVHCALGVRCPPYSSGSLNCLSAEQKCDDVTAIARFAALLSVNIAPSASVCAIVEHAPYCPINGIFNSLSPNVEDMH